MGAGAGVGACCGREMRPQSECKRASVVERWHCSERKLGTVIWSSEYKFAGDALELSGDEGRG